MQAQNSYLLYREKKDLDRDVCGGGGGVTRAKSPGLFQTVPYADVEVFLAETTVCNVHCTLIIESGEVSKV
jgi:hypothetical protein